MRNIRVHIVIIVAALAAAISVVSFAARTSRGQSPSPKSESKVKPTVLITGPASTSAANALSPFAAATARNVILKNELSWTFGGKQQRGWYLYDLLIGQTLKSQNDPVTGDFASALAVWQKKTGMSPSGVLDEDSLMAMVSEWQSNRLKNRIY